MGKYTAAVPDHLVLPARVQLTRADERLFHLLGRQVPAPVAVRLLIDTGSGRTSLSPAVLAHLNPPSRGAVQVGTALGSGRTNLFWVRMDFPGTSLVEIPVMAVVRLGLPPPLRSFQGVIGRDLLRRWEYLHFEGRRGRFTVRDVPGWLGRWFRT